MRVLAAVLLTSGALAGASLSVRVSNSLTGAGVPGVRFRICQSIAGALHCGDTNYNIVSDDAGAFHIGSLADGEYAILNLSAKGFQVTGATSIHVSGDSQFDLRLTPKANIRGRVFDPDGNPAAGVSVRVANWPGSPKITNENGEFLLEAVGAGSRVILAATPSAQAVAKSASKDGTRLVTTYYPSAIAMDQAVKITMTGVDASYDIRLQTAFARTIKGLVMGVSGKPAPHVSVAIYKSEPAPITLIRGMPMGGLLPQTSAAQPVETGDDGTFAFPPVLEGDWTLSAMVASGRETTMGSARISISARDAAAGDISDVQIQLAKPFDVEVSADWGDSAPPSTSRGRSFASAIPLNPENPRIGMGGSSGEPGEPQQLRLFPGRYIIAEGTANGMQLTPGFYAAAAMLDGRDVLNQAVELSGPASIKMIYKSSGGSVHGTVEKGPDATIILLADAKPDAIIGYSGRCDDNGAFTIQDLPPGEYTAIALTETYFVDPRSPDFVTAANRDGKRVNVEAGAAAQLDLRLSVMQ
ncbi:MAG TPA: carboxypeptidase-like regulatory domain-containing protein [Bryobacteraceae bacterium]|jgi:hypothetical protein